MPALSARLLLSLHRLLPQVADESADQTLLDRFRHHGDQEAFSVLVARHGPMVLAVCRRLLRDADAVEDAFQATFLILARQAGAIRRAEALAGWLHQVARRAALQARTAQARARREQSVPSDLDAADSRPDPLEEITGRELLALIDEEIHRLPRDYRAPLVLCYLEGRSQDEAARLLGWSPGSVKGRLERGRALLRDRLSKRGLDNLAPLPALAAVRPLPADLLAATLRAAAPDGVKRAGALALAGALAKGGLARGAVAALLLLAAGLVTAAFVAEQPTPPSRPPAPDRAPAKEAWKEEIRPVDPLPQGAVVRLGTQRLRHAGRVGCVAFAPDGKTMASSAADQTIAVWDATSGKRRNLFGYRLGDFWYDGADRLAFDPKGRFLMVGRHVDFSWQMSGWGARPRLVPFDLVTGKEKPGLWPKVSGSVCSLAISGDGATLAAADEEGGLIVLDLATGKEKFKLDLPADCSYQLCFTADGKTLIAAPHRSREPNRELLARIHLFDAAGGKKLRIFAGEGKYGVEALAAGRDPNLLAVLATGRAQLWRLSTGAKVRDLTTGTGARGLAFSPDGKSVAVGLAGCESGEVHLFDTATGKQRLRLAGFASSLAFSPDGRTLATAGADCAVRLWNVATGKPLLPIAGPTHSTSALAFSADARTLVTGTDDGVVRVWDARTGAERAAHRLRPRPHFSVFGDVRITPAGRALVTPADVPQAAKGAPPVPVLWDALTGKVVLSLPPVPIEGKSWSVSPVQLSPDGATIAYGQQDEVILADAATGRPRLRWRNSDGDPAVVGFSADGRRLAVVARSRIGEAVLRIHDSSTGKALARIQDRSIHVVALSPNGRIVATAGPSSVIVFWDGETGQELGRTAGGSFQSLAFAPDGSILASGDWKGQVRLWDVAKRSAVFSLNAQAGGVRRLAFADNRRLATAGWDTTVLVWDLAAAVRGTAAGVQPSRRDLEAAWRDLGGIDLPAVFRASTTLRLDIGQALRLFRSDVRTIPEVSKTRLNKLVQDLDDDDFAVRQKASRELALLGSLARDVLEEAVRKAPSLEVKRRAADLLETIRPGVRRVVRLVALLAESDDPQARALLRELSRGAGEAEETRAARLALKRLPKGR
jgi:RNA polymerase sigma factor (sigma-70 family)